MGGGDLLHLLRARHHSQEEEPPTPDRDAREPRHADAKLRRGHPGYDGAGDADDAMAVPPTQRAAGRRAPAEGHRRRGEGLSLRVLDRCLRVQAGGFRAGLPAPARLFRLPRFRQGRCGHTLRVSRVRMTMPTLSRDDLRRRLERGAPITVLDVRPTAERAEWCIPGSVHADAYDALRRGDPTADRKSDV